MLGSAAPLYAATSRTTDDCRSGTLRVETPDASLDSAFAWAKVGIDKGLATNPRLGTGLLAGFRTSGDSERPGFAWFFGRDALWTVVRAALLRRLRRSAGRARVPAAHPARRRQGPARDLPERSLMPWFTDYPYPWNSADATPLFVVAHADHFRARGDRAFLDGAWDVRSSRRGASPLPPTRTATAWSRTRSSGTAGWRGARSTRPTRRSTSRGCGSRPAAAWRRWPQARATRRSAEEAQGGAERHAAAVEKTYWLADRGFYGFAT